MTNPNGSGQRRAGYVLLLIVAVVAGLFGGMWWQGSRAHDGESAVSAAPAAPKQLWTCSMHPQVIREEPGSCPICHMALTPVQVDGEIDSSIAPSDQPSAERKIKYWWDPMMNPPYISDKPGKSPMGMDLIAVYEDEAPSAGTRVTIDPTIVQNMGVRTAAVTRGPLRREIRAVGLLEQPEPRLYDINLRVAGWVEKLYADTEGMLIQKGEPLFELYSPDVLVGVEELIVMRRTLDALSANSEESLRESAEIAYEAAGRKLEFWGIPREQIEKLSKLDSPPGTITFSSPVTAELAEKMIVQGAAVMAGDRVLRLADRSVVWLNVQIFAQDLSLVSVGQSLTATVESFPGREFAGQIVFIHPRVDMSTRTALVRIEIDNSGLDLRPGMFATAQVAAELAEDAVLIPDEAVIDTGARQMVFVALGGGRFEPRSIKTGMTNGEGMVEVLEGLMVSDTVVTSGQFLLDAESRMREAIQKYLSQSGAAADKAVAPTVHQH